MKKIKTNLLNMYTIKLEKVNMRLMNLKKC